MVPTLMKPVQVARAPSESWTFSTTVTTWAVGERISRDPISEPGGINLYVLALNDPLQRFDAVGLLSEKDSTDLLLQMKDSVMQAAKAFGICPRTMAAIIYAEARFNVSVLDQVQGSELLKDLVMTSNGSIGPAQIKPNTALEVEKYLHDPKSAYYLGQDYADMIPPSKSSDELWTRLKDPSWSSKYLAAMLKMFEVHWEDARSRQIALGIKGPESIKDDPDILATLFNLGFNRVRPKPNPESNVFGKNALDFYQSGKLCDQYPCNCKQYPKE